MNHADEPSTAYLLRLRRVDNGGLPVWLFALESPDGRSRHWFSDLAALMAFLALITTGAGIDP